MSDTAVSISGSNSINCWKIDGTADLKRCAEKLDAGGYQEVLAALHTENEARSKAQLCKRCAALGLCHMLDQITDSIREHGSPKNLSFDITKLCLLQPRELAEGIHSCPLCHLLFYTLSGNKSISNPDDKEFGVEYGSDDTGRLRRGWKPRMLSTFGSWNESLERYIYAIPVDLELSWPRACCRVNAQADLELLREWVLHCDRNHRCCQPINSCAMWTPTFVISLIDCYRLVVKKHDKGDRYAALSYVWGATPAPSPLSAPLQLEQLPKTIQDAIFVATSIGIRYLWVDRYCISQEGQTKHEQISHMGQIYSQAEVTIVALKGDPSFGLPGVNGTLRRPQPRARVGNHTLASTLSAPKYEIESSVWNKRGWTFQEAFLSRRLLFFTDEQMYFQCREVDCCESIDTDTILCRSASQIQKEKLEKLWRSGWESIWKGGQAYCNNLLSECTFSTESIWDLIAQYSKKDLTFSGDYLNAFLGILRMFENSPYPIYHAWGIPLALDVATGHLPANFLYSLAWEFPDQAKRRTGFPSWSWLGWNGNISAPLNIGVYNKFDSSISQSPSSTAVVLIELNDGRRQTLDDYIASDDYHSPLLTMTPRLYVHAWTTAIHLDCAGLLESLSENFNGIPGVWENLSYPNDFDVKSVLNNITLDTRKNENLRLGLLDLAFGTTLSQLTSLRGVLFQEPQDYLYARTIVLISGGLLGSVEGKGGSKTTSHEESMVKKPGSRIGSVRLYDKKKGHNLDRWKWETHESWFSPYTKRRRYHKPAMGATTHLFAIDVLRRFRTS